MIRKTLNIVLDQNPESVTFAHEISRIEEIRLVYFRLSGIDTSAVPTHLYVKVDDDMNIRQSSSINSSNLSTGNNFVRATSAMVPLHFELANPYFDGPNPTQYPVIYGIQPEDICWQAREIDSLKSFRISLIGVDGTDYVMPAGAVLQYVFSLKYRTATTPVNTVRKGF